MKKTVQSTLIALGILPFSLLGNDIITNKSNSVSTLTQTRAIVQLMQGKNTGGQLDLLLPFYGNNTHFLYTDLQAYKYDELYQTLSAGLGGRSFRDNAVYGVYAFYDFQTSPHNFNYNRVNFGVERLGDTWEWRANLYSYLNENHKINDLGQTSAFFQGNNIKYNHTYEAEQAYILGGDLEMGRSLGLEALRGYAAYYNYGNEITGGRVRVSYELNSHWQVLATSQYDTARGWLSYGAINYWLGNAKTTTGTALDKLRDAIVRDMTVAAKIVDNYNEIDTDSRHIYFANPNDTASLETTLASAKEGDFIYLEAGEYNLNSAINLQTTQTLWGTGADLYVNNLLLIPASGTTTLNANNIASLATPNCGTYVCAIYATNSSNYGGFDLTNSGTNIPTLNFAGLMISNTNNVNLNSLNINNFTFGLYANNATIQSAQNINSSNNTSTGIFLNQNTSMINASNITTSNNGTATNPNNGYGILVSTKSSLSGSNFTLNNNTNTALLVSGGTAYLTGSSFEQILTPYPGYTGVDAIAIQGSGTLTVITPTKLTGKITEFGEGNSVTITNAENQSYIPTLTNKQPVTCDINNSIGTCQ